MGEFIFSNILSTNSDPNNPHLVIILLEKDFEIAEPLFLTKTFVA